MKRIIIFVLLIFRGIMQMDAQNVNLINIFDYGWNYSSDKYFFDERNCKIDTNYNEIFISLWTSLEREHKIGVSSSGAIGFPPVYLKFEGDNVFKIVCASSEKFGVYKFDSTNRILYLKLDDNDYVFSIEYYKYIAKKKYDFDWGNILELYKCINVKWDTPYDEIMKTEKILYQRFGRTEFSMKN